MNIHSDSIWKIGESVPFLSNFFGSNLNKSNASMCCSYIFLRMYWIFHIVFCFVEIWPNLTEFTVVEWREDSWAYVRNNECTVRTIRCVSSGNPVLVIRRTKYYYKDQKIIVLQLIFIHVCVTKDLSVHVFYDTTTSRCTYRYKFCKQLNPYKSKNLMSVGMSYVAPVSLKICHHQFNDKYLLTASATRRTFGTCLFSLH